MPVTNEFLAFATNPGANVLSQAEWEVLAARVGGFSAGVAESPQLNKAWRQSALIGASLAQFLTEFTGQNMFDDGDVARIVSILLAATGGVSPGQCRISVATDTSLVLLPCLGANITIEGVRYTLDPLGTFANTLNCLVNGVSGQALVASTTYDVFVRNREDLGGRTLDFWSATGHTPDLATPGNFGVEIGGTVLAPDPTRTLVGKVRTTAGAILTDTALNRLCLNWYNRRSRALVNTIVALVGPFNSADPLELSGAARVNFLTWADEATTIKVTAGGSNSVATKDWHLFPAVDSSTVPWANTANQFAGFSIDPGQEGTGTAMHIGELAEGNHFATALGSNSAGTVTFRNILLAGQIVG